MPGTTDPPRPSITPNVRTHVQGCTWANNRLELAGVPQIAWLNQSGVPGMSASVYWEVGSAAQASPVPTCVVPQLAYDIIKNGTYNQQTGVLTYLNKNYRFRYEVVGGAPTMQPFQV